MFVAAFVFGGPTVSAPARASFVPHRRRTPVW